VGQVRLIFKINLANSNDLIHGRSLAYVQWFSKPADTAEGGIKMYLVERSLNWLTKERYGAIVPLSSIFRFVQLIPQFGPKVHELLTSSNSIELARLFYVNSFGDKEIYQSVY